MRGPRTRRPAQNRNQASTATETIRGVIAGITAEGEAMFDYRANRAVAAEAAFLTVVGSPSQNARCRSDPTDRRRKRRTRCVEPKAAQCLHRLADPADQDLRRPRARVKSRPPGAETRQAEQKREVALDNLEVGDHVEIQFTKNDDSGATGSAHQTEQMRQETRTPPHACRFCNRDHHPPGQGNGAARCRLADGRRRASHSS